MKYFLIGVLAILSLLSNVIRIDGDDTVNKGIFKKLTGVGLGIIFFTFFIAILAGFETYNEDSENANKAKKTEQNLVAKNKSDSLRFYQTYNRLIQTHEDILKGITLSKSYNNRQILELQKLYFLIPDKLGVYLEAEILLSQRELLECKKLMAKVYKDELEGFGFGELGIRLLKSKVDTSLNNIFTDLHKMSIEIGIGFRDVNSNFIIDINKKNGLNTDFSDNYVVVYSPYSKRFELHLFNLICDVNRNKSAKNLLDIQGKTIYVHINLSAGNRRRDIEVDLKEIKLLTKDGLSLNVKNLKNSNYNLFEKQLTKKEIWE